MQQLKGKFFLMMVVEVLSGEMFNLEKSMMMDMEY
jgi:hypothetical protein